MNPTKTDTFKDVMCGNVKYEYLHYFDIGRIVDHHCLQLSLHN
jgi:hypothetical protein